MRKAVHLIVKPGEELRSGQTFTRRATSKCHWKLEIAPLMRSTTMTNVNWIELSAVAEWLASTPEEVMDLVRDGVLGWKRISRVDFVVSAVDVKSLARLWRRIPRKYRRVAICQQYCQAG